MYTPRLSLAAFMFALGGLHIADTAKAVQTAPIARISKPRKVVGAPRFNRRGKQYPEAKARRIAIAKAYNEELRNGPRIS